MSIAVVENNETVVENTSEAFYVQHTTPSNVSIESETTAFISRESTETVVVFQETTTVVAAGFQGPPGPAGIAEEDVVYSKRIDFITDDLLYKGEAEVGSSESAPVWRVRKITVSADGDVTEVWAGGTANFVNSWTNRASYIYS